MQVCDQGPLTCGNLLDSFLDGNGSDGERLLVQLRRLTVKNYRGIADFEVPVGRQGVLVGPNESGKTSILRLLDLLLGATQQQIYSTVDVSDFSDPSKPLVVQVHLGDLDEQELAAFPDEVDFSLDPPLVAYCLEVDCVDVSSGEFQVRRWFPSAGHDRPATRDQVAAFGWSLIPADRNLIRDLGAARTGALRRLLAAVEVSDPGPLESALRQLRLAVGSQLSMERFKASLASALANALPPGGRPAIEFVLRGDLEGDLLGSVDVALNRGRGRPTALLHEQSDGIRALTAVAIYSMAVTDRGIVAIDEPETHLHPAAQRAVGRLLAELPAQSLVATHSSHVVAEANPFDVIALSPFGSPRILKPGSTATRADFIARWWTSGLVELLTCRCVAVVEGPADRIIVERAARAHGVNLGRSGIAVLDLEGASNFKNAFAVIGPVGFDVQFRALGDEDTRNNWANWAQEPNPAQLESRGFTFSATDLEDEYVRALGARRLLFLLASSGFVSLAQIRAASGAAALAQVTPGGMVAVCRKYKPEAATAVALRASDEEIRRIASVARFIRTLPR